MEPVPDSKAGYSQAPVVNSLLFPGTRQRDEAWPCSDTETGKELVVASVAHSPDSGEKGNSPASPESFDSWLAISSSFSLIAGQLLLVVI